PRPASYLPNVRPRPHEVAAGLCGRCSGGDRNGAATDGTACDDLRVRRTSRLYLRGDAPNYRPRSQTQVHANSNPICCMACAGLVRGNAATPASHSESSGADANRQRFIPRDTRIWRAWNIAAFDRGDTPGDIMGSL